MRGVVSLENADNQVPASFEGGWWRDGYPLRTVGRWTDGAVVYEIGKRAHGCLMIENRRLPVME